MNFLYKNISSIGMGCWAIDVPLIQSTVKEHDLVALIRSPLAMVVLTGKYDENTSLPSEDVRAVNNERRDYFHDGKPSQNHLNNLEAIQELLQTGGEP